MIKPETGFDPMSIFRSDNSSLYDMMMKGMRLEMERKIQESVIRQRLRT